MRIFKFNPKAYRDYCDNLRKENFKTSVEAWKQHTRAFKEKIDGIKTTSVKEFINKKEKNKFAYHSSPSHFIPNAFFRQLLNNSESGNSGFNIGEEGTRAPMPPQIEKNWNFPATFYKKDDENNYSSSLFDPRLLPEKIAKNSEYDAYRVSFKSYEISSDKISDFKVQLKDHDAKLQYSDLPSAGFYINEQYNSIDKIDQSNLNNNSQNLFLQNLSHNINKKNLNNYSNGNDDKYLNNLSADVCKIKNNLSKELKNSTFGAKSVSAVKDKNPSDAKSGLSNLWINFFNEENQNNKINNLTNSRDEVLNIKKFDTVSEDIKEDNSFEN